MDTPLSLTPDELTIKAGDTSPFEVTVHDADGEADLSDVRRARLTIAPRFGDPIVSEGRVDIVEESDLRYDWRSGETDSSGVYRGEFELQTSDGTFYAPTEGFLTITITDHP